MNVRLSQLATRYHNNSILRFLLRPIWRLYAKYDKAKGIRILQQHGTDVLNTLHRVFSTANIPYWLEFGTLLGAVREHDFISTDDDIDIGVFYSDVSKIQETLLATGFKLVREFKVGDGSLGFEQTYFFHGVPVDIFFNHRKNSKELCFHSFTFVVGDDRNLCNVEEVTIPYSGFMAFDFKGIKVTIPRDYELHLGLHYGEDFMVPNPSFDYKKGARNIYYYPVGSRVGIYHEF